MKRILFSVFILLVGLKSNAQKDTTFWFAAPDLSSAFGYDRPNFIRFTSYQLACTITVSQPANPSFPVQTLTLAPFTTQSLNVTPWIDILECTPGNVVQNRGLKIKSDNRIAAYYEVNVNGPNPEIYALKGKNALGTSFYISSQDVLYNADEYSPLPFSSFNIVATEDNTIVTIIPTNAIVGHAANVSFNITLNKGQTYAAIAQSQLANQHLGGSKVTSTKPIAITLSDDLLNGGIFGSTCRDIAGDQTIPVNALGTEYIAIKGSLNFPNDKVFVTATQNGTGISQDGILISTVNAGQTAVVNVNNPSTYIQTSAPAYAYHLSGAGCEVGSAILPKINCTGSSSLSITRSSNEPLYITLLVKNGGQGNFLVNNTAGVVNAAQFNVVPGTGGVWYFAKINLFYPNGSVIKVDNTTSLFQLGFLQGGTLGASFGYFSDYNALIAEASSSNYQPCAGSNVNLSTESVSSATYSWQGPGGFTSNIRNPVLNNVQPVNSGFYVVNVTVPGCGVFKDSVNIIVKPKSFSTVNQVICEGQSYQGYNTAGTFIDTFIAANGCDSIRTLNLTIKPKSYSTINQTICEGQSYLGYNVSGTYVNTFGAANGCDSIRTLNLTVKPKSYTTINQVICEGQVFQGYSVSGTYLNTFIAANGCDSIRTLNLTVKPKSYLTINVAICPGGNYAGYTNSGTYINTFIGANGCDSIRTLNLTLNTVVNTSINITICQGQTYAGYATSGQYVNTFTGSNGCDSTRTLNLTVKPKSFSTLAQIICEGQSYLGHTTTGTFIDTLVAANGCDSIRTLNLTVKPKSYTTINQVICEGQVFQGYSVSGTYLNTFIAANGCDSIRTLNLTVKPKSYLTINVAICPGGNYAGYTNSGTYINTFIGANGCDSIRTLNLTLNTVVNTSINITICQGQTYAGYATSGQYVNTFTGSNGCDSTRTLNLTVKPKSFSTLAQIICDGQSYLGHTTTGTFIDTLVAANGCDSIRTLNLTVKPRSFTTINQSICEGQVFQGYSVSGTYVNTFVAANGCDSIRTLNLTVKLKSYLTINASICPGGNYAGYTTSGTYVNTFTGANGCDSIRTLNLTLNAVVNTTINQAICQGQTYAGYATSGQYVNTFTGSTGCDSVRTLNLIVKPNSFSAMNKIICSGESFEGHTTTGTYVNTYVSANGCDSTRTLNLLVNSRSFFTLAKTICEGQAFEGYTLTGNYIDTLVSATGCDSVRTLNLLVLKFLKPDLGPDKSICFEDKIILNPGVFNSYLWQDGSVQSTYTVTKPGIYSVTVTNSCSTAKDVIVITEKSCEIFFPNVFTPNSDNKNDFFRILNAYNMRDYSLSVYNRWGEKVFGTNDFNKGWDGRYKGLPSELGTYVWVCTFKKGTSIQNLKGSVLLLR